MSTPSSDKVNAKSTGIFLVPTADGKEAGGDFKPQADAERGPTNGFAGPKRPGGHRRAGGLPLNHPMHPSQFSGDKYDRRAIATLLGSFFAMVRYFPFLWVIVLP